MTTIYDVDMMTIFIVAAMTSGQHPKIKCTMRIFPAHRTTIEVMLGMNRKYLANKAAKV